MKQTKEDGREHKRVKKKERKKKRKKRKKKLYYPRREESEKALSRVKESRMRDSLNPLRVPWSGKRAT